jgi:hypothetical protein
MFTFRTLNFWDLSVLHYFVQELVKLTRLFGNWIFPSSGKPDVSILWETGCFHPLGNWMFPSSGKLDVSTLWGKLDVSLLWET